SGKRFAECRVALVADDGFSRCFHHLLRVCAGGGAAVAVWPAAQCLDLCRRECCWLCSGCRTRVVYLVTSSWLIQILQSKLSNHRDPKCLIPNFFATILNLSPRCWRKKASPWTSKRFAISKAPARKPR